MGAFADTRMFSMKWLSRFLLCLLVTLGAGCATPSAAPTHPAKAQAKPAPLLLISINAYRYDYIERGLSPTLAMLATTGVQAASMQPSFPSLTFPNHYT